jgi:tRNA nucleotidyltransferase (CCA-adding enzyme)
MLALGIRSLRKLFAKNIESSTSLPRFPPSRYPLYSTRQAMVSITLTEKEDLLRRFLLDCAERLPVELRPELRFAGGWVRDKLLELPSHDIDVALSSMTGAEFGKHLQEFSSKHGDRYESEAAALGISARLRSLNYIAENPEKSKHLATMTTKFLGFDLDFANLRKETYSDTSRNPEMEFGTPEEDALRRDATINALFYNLRTQEVEDFTSRGLSDLDKKIIGTPLEPYQTFKDDPLRVLRLIRFASKYEFEINSEALAAMKDKSIHHALKIKISRERVGVEVEKMISGPHPHRALMLIQDLDLYESVFANPNNDFVPELALVNARIYDGLQIILETDNLVKSVLFTKADQALLWYLAAYAAWKDVEPAKVKLAAWEGIKATRENQQVIEKAVANRQQILSVIEMAQGVPRPSDIGMAIRRLDPHANTWRFQILYSMLCDFYEHDAKSVVQRYNTFAEYVRSQSLENIHERVPIINGRKMAEVLQTKTGPWMKGALDLVMAWQLDNPDGSRDDAIEMVKQKRAEILKT